MSVPDPSSSFHLDVLTLGKVVFSGDVTYVDGEVIAKQEESEFGVPVVTVQTVMTTQSGEVILKGTADVELC